MRAAPALSNRTTWRTRIGTLVATTLVFAGTGVVASRVVPVGYEASIELRVPQLPHGGEMLREASAAALVPNGSERVRPMQDGVRVAASSADAKEAERRVAALADRVEAQVRLLSQVQPAAAPTPVAMVETDFEPEPEPQPAETQTEGVRPDAALGGLQRTADDARTQLAAAEQALADFETTIPAEIEDEGDRLGAAGDEVEERTAALAVLQADRARIGAPSVTADQVQSLQQVAGRDDFANALEQRRAASQTVADLSRTLLDGHPRMAAARARLRDLDAVVDTTGTRVENAIETRIAAAERQLAEARTNQVAASEEDSRRRALQMRHTELLRAEELARELSARLDEAVRQAGVRFAVSTPVVVPAAPSAEELPPVPPVPAPAHAPISQPQPVPQPTVDRRTLPTEAQHARPLPVALISALFGFGLAGLGLMVRRRVGEPVASSAPVEAMPHSVSDAVPRTDDGSASVLDITSVDDVIDGAISSDVRRIMVSRCGSPDGGRPLAVSIARRLSLRGRAVALVDLSVRQTAARTMGVGASAPTLADLIAGRVSFATVAARDFATQAEIVPGGTTQNGTLPDTAAERRNVLDFVEKSYEVIVVDCTGIEPAGMAALMDADAALLLVVDDASDETIRQRIEHMKGAGLEDMILVREGAA